MSLIKLGEAVTIQSSDLKSEASITSDPETLVRLEKFANEIKAIAPKAKDFLYFSAIMMHAAEAALLNSDGSIKKDASGKEVTARWEKVQDQNGESIKWVCSDPNIKPTKNANGDIFPEFSLVEAHKKWIGKPLCLDHKSSSVDMIRGLIIDTYYDWPQKRVIALCALDKVNYPDLARKVSTGYATSVSMGTAVGRAVCFDCGRVARVEGDFCHHMRTKSSYGEVNLDLNPIELSIVVNGADPHAKIRHIVAAANQISEYVEFKQKEFNKIAIDETPDINAAQSISEGIDKIKEELDSLKIQIEDLKKREEEEQKIHESNESNNQNTDDVKEHNKNSSFRYSQDSIKLANVIGDIYQNLTNLQDQISKLSKRQHNEETEMTTKQAYWQSGGGVNEPAPGAVKYPKEEADKIRDTEDKHMQNPANFGPVDGMFPGDEQKKRALQRLAQEREERALRRQAALEKAKNKIAYWQSGGDVNEPTLGKPKYPKEEADKIRDNEDKHMQGASPFPNVGKVDGLYGDDEKKKKLLSRATKLSAKFVKAANSDGSEDQANSLWQVFADKKLILSATVQDLTGGKVEALYDSVATDEFGKRLMKTVRAEGVDKAMTIFKGAEATHVTTTAPTAPAAPALNMGETGGMPMETPVSQLPGTTDEGGAGDPKDELMNKLDEAESVLSDIRAGVSALTNEGNELENFDQLQAEAPELAEKQNKLSKALLIGMRKVASQLDNHVNELKLAKDVYDNYDLVRDSDARYVNDLTKEACEDTRKVIEECKKYMHAFVRYADGIKIILNKQASMRKSAQLLNQDPTHPANFKVHNPGDPLDSDLGQYAPSSKPKAPVPAAKPPVLAPKKPALKPAPAKPKSPADELPLPYGDRSTLETMLINNTQQSPMSAPGVAPIAPGHEVQYAKDHEEENDEDCNDAVQVDKDGKMTADSPEEAGKAMKAMKSTASEFDLNSKEGRAQLRAKLAEKAMSVTDLMNKAHGTSGPMVGGLDTKPSGNLGKVENLQEVQNAMMDVANATPKVKKQAADIQKLVVAGKLDPEKDFPALVAKGLDNEAVKYWKSFYGQAKDGGSQFAAELVKEHTQQKMAEEQEAYRVKIARAYEVAYEMSNKGMIGSDKKAIKQQVDELMSFNDKAFESVQRWVNKQAMKKQASIPQVGLRGEEYFETKAESRSYQDNMTDELRAIFANRRY